MPMLPSSITTQYNYFVIYIIVSHMFLNRSSFFFGYGVKLSLVSNCPRCQIVRFCMWCQIVRCQIVRCQIVRCQIVHGVKLSAVSNCPVSNCPRCQIVRGVKLSAVSNCPVSNCPRIGKNTYLRLLMSSSWRMGSPPCQQIRGSQLLCRG